MGTTGGGPQTGSEAYLDLSDADRREVIQLAAGDVMRDASKRTLEFSGRVIRVDPAAEILAKKILYRADLFKARDVFDMVAALVHDPEAANDALRATRHAHPNLLQRLGSLAKQPADALLQDIVHTESGKQYIDGMVPRLIQAVNVIQNETGGPEKRLIGMKSKISSQKK